MFRFYLSEPRETNTVSLVRRDQLLQWEGNLFLESSQEHKNGKASFFPLTISTYSCFFGKTPLGRKKEISHRKKSVAGCPEVGQQSPCLKKKNIFHIFIREQSSSFSLLSAGPT